MKVGVMSRAFRLLLAALAGIALACGWVAPAYAADNTIIVDATLSPEGVLEVTQTISLPVLSGGEAMVLEIPTRMDHNGTRYTYEIIDLLVTPADGVTITENAQSAKISFPAGEISEFTATYQVRGATTRAVDGGVDFTWMVFAGMTHDVAKVSGAVMVPPGANNYDCSAGVPGALVTCSTYSTGAHGSTTLEFTNLNTAAGEIVQTHISFQADAVPVTEEASPIWTLGRALSPGWAQLGISVLVLAVGALGLFALWRRVRTAGYSGSPALMAGFSKDENGHLVFITDPHSRPGLIGTLVDSKVDPADILATILDLAVRGHLRITEIETNRYSAPDWFFTRLEGTDELKPYEAELLNALTMNETKVSELTSNVAPAIESVQESLYKEMLTSGWFSRLPSKNSKLVPWAWITVGIALVVLVLLVIFTTFGLVGLVLIALAIIFLYIAYQAPPVTPKGAAVYAGLQALSNDFHAYLGSDIDQTQLYNEVSRILPYAVVLGGSDRWLGFLVDADDDPDPDSTDLSWYHAPDDWHLKYLPASLDTFITTVTGRLFTRI